MIKTRINKNLLLFFISFFIMKFSFTQVESPLLSFNRGMLWQSLMYGKVGPTFSSWKRTGPSLDWPSFDPSWIRENIGGPASHMVTGGFWVGAKKSKDSVIAVEDWSIYGGTVSNEASAKYIVTKHSHLYKNGENYWLQKNPLIGEEVIETSWEYNLNYVNLNDLENVLPVRVKRVAHQWSGSKKDENYIIYEYTIKNISKEIKQKDPTRKVADTLFGFYMMLNYGLQTNSRSWNVLFPQEPPGAKNTWMFFDPVKKLFWGRATDYPLTTTNEEYGFSNSLGRIVDGKPKGEWLAPGFVGVCLLYSSPDSSGQHTRVHKYGWSAGDNSSDLSGPFNGIPGRAEDKYRVVSNPSNAFQFVGFSGDNVFMKKSRMWSLMTLGPWNINPDDSIVVAVAEIVDGMDYKNALNKELLASQIFSLSQKVFNSSVERARLTYYRYRNQTTGNINYSIGLNHPDPPSAPKFKIDFYRGESQLVANVLTWNKDSESFKDPDDNTNDLVGYRIYRSDFLPIGPWDTIATIYKGDINFFDVSSGQYKFVDSTVDIGTAYYYSLTAFDTGKSNWSIDPNVIFPETGSNKVPPMESSIFANRMIQPFLATLPPKNSVNDVIIVPNPFVIGKGFSQPGERDQIQFVNVPNPCTIRIYTIRGDLVKTINVTEDVGGIVKWNQITDFGQFVESGIYIYHIESNVGNKIGKLAIVR